MCYSVFTHHKFHRERCELVKNTAEKVCKYIQRISTIRRHAQRQSAMERTQPACTGCRALYEVYDGMLGEQRVSALSACRLTSAHAGLEVNNC